MVFTVVHNFPKQNKLLLVILTLNSMLSVLYWVGIGNTVKRSI